MRLDKIEKEALKQSLKDFKGEVYLFGSRLDDGKRGGDIDILVKPAHEENSLKLSIDIQKKNFFNMRAKTGCYCLQGRFIL